MLVSNIVSKHHVFALLLPSIVMTISSTLLALVLMPLCLWIYSRAWINTPVVNLMPFGAIILTLCSTLIPIGLGVMLRYRYTRVADIVLKVIRDKSLFINEMNYCVTAHLDLLEFQLRRNIFPKSAVRISL